MVIMQHHACKKREFGATESRQYYAVNSDIKEPFDVNDVSILLPMDLILGNEFELSKYMTNNDFQAVLNVQNDPKAKKFQEDGQIGSPLTYGPQTSKIANWRIVSLRADTCAPGAHFAETLAQTEEALRNICVAQLRLVAQSFAEEGADGNQPAKLTKVGEDITLHLLFNIGKPTDESANGRIGELLSRLDEIRKSSKNKTTGTPLGVHPGLADKATRENTKQEVQKLLGEFAKPDTLSSVAAMGLANGRAEPWIFFAMIRDSSNTLTLVKIPTVDKLEGASTARNPTQLAESEDRSAGKSFFQALSFESETHVIGNPSKTPYVADSKTGLPTRIELTQTRSTKEIFDSSAPKFDVNEILPLAAASSQLKLDLLFAIDSPSRSLKSSESNEPPPKFGSFFFNTDCVSCHSSENLLQRRVSFLNGQKDAASKSELDLLQSGNSPARYKVPKGVTGYGTKNTRPIQAAFGDDPAQTFGPPWSLRNFGYFRGMPTVSFRTVNESAEAVEFINRKNLSLDDNGPNACAQLSENQWSTAEQQLWSCMHFPGKSVKACMQTFCNSSN
jgi:hypothetical protein